MGKAKAMKLYLDGDIPHRAKVWRNDPNIFKWCRQHTFISREEQLLWEKKIVSDPTIKMFGIYDDELELDSQYGSGIGVCGFTSIDYRLSHAEFSLYIARQFQGFGYGKEALRLLLDHGFNDFGFNLIWGETFDGNPAAHMFEKLGFVKEGTVRQRYLLDGKRIDAHLYSMTKEEFDALDRNC